MKSKNNNFKVFGERLSKTMFRQDISNSELAREMYVSPSTISGYRTGRRSPTVADLAALTKILGVSADFLIGNTDSETGSIHDPTERKRE